MAQPRAGVDVPPPCGRERAVPALPTRRYDKPVSGARVGAGVKGSHPGLQAYTVISFIVIDSDVLPPGSGATVLT
jgi:hypothetical protein